ncbi:MerR family transcriptional regulator [Streptomyces oryzae]|uniref:MerR family transcriptional regulator n=1 Tax=Streptomyces oryzae TaxID=1434886 RepID=A0ABS3XG60_9ACTN|nr:MerR family transcriptional regulator [Streptomyces oryzae]MBO8194333.1 MerR family transcriptional regulator [Streptomyces oryzae]
MKISQLTERSGVPATTLRFYEKAGLLAADRTPAGYRMYGEEAIERLRFISAAKHLGLPLEEIGELLAVWETGACRDVKAGLRPRIAARLAAAQQRAAELATFTASLHTALDHLDALPDRAEKCDPQCGFLTTSEPGPPRPVQVALSPSPQAAEDERERRRTAPVACSLTGDGMAERADQWRRVLSGADRTEMADGLRLTLPADRAAAIAGLAADEQQCCPFFGFRLHLDGEALHLEVRAPADGHEVLTRLFAAD